MGPFEGAGVSLLGIALFAVLAFVVWVFNKGREGAKVPGAETPTTQRTPIDHFRRDCPRCGSTYELSGNLTAEFAEEQYGKWHAKHVCYSFDDKSTRDNQPTNQTGAGG